MDMIKSQLLKIWHGLFYGTGVFIAFLCLNFIAAKFNINAPKPYSNASGLSVSEVRNTYDGGRFNLVGVLSNSGDDVWYNTWVKVDLYNSDGVFVDSCREYIQDIAYPEQALKFKVSCYPTEYDSFGRYEMRIVDAVHKFR